MSSVSNIILQSRFTHFKAWKVAFFRIPSGYVAAVSSVSVKELFMKIQLHMRFGRSGCIWSYVCLASNQEPPGLCLMDHKPTCTQEEQTEPEIQRDADVPDGPDRIYSRSSPSTDIHLDATPLATAACNRNRREGDRDRVHTTAQLEDPITA